MAEATNTDVPTVVLVHGAFADASSWNGVITRLRDEGVPVTAPPNPLRGISADTAYIASVFAQIDGSVLAVGHSYGGAVIANAATMAKNVVGLVFVAASTTVFELSRAVCTIPFTVSYVPLPSARKPHVSSARANSIAP